MTPELKFDCITAAEWMNWGLGKGAEKVGGLLTLGGEKLRANLKPSTTDRSVDASYQRGLVTARYASDKVLVVSSFVGEFNFASLGLLCQLPPISNPHSTLTPATRAVSVVSVVVILRFVLENKMKNSQVFCELSVYADKTT